MFGSNDKEEKTMGAKNDQLNGLLDKGCSFEGKLTFDGTVQINGDFQGEIFYFYLLLYSLWRFFIEFFRGDSEIFILGISVFQIFSIALFVLSAVMLFRIKRQPV